MIYEILRDHLDERHEAISFPMKDDDEDRIRIEALTFVVPRTATGTIQTIVTTILVFALPGTCKQGHLSGVVCQSSACFWSNPLRGFYLE